MGGPARACLGAVGSLDVAEHGLDVLIDECTLRRMCLAIDVADHEEKIDQGS
jgi:hypothetical protein